MFALTFSEPHRRGRVMRLGIVGHWASGARVNSVESMLKTALAVIERQEDGLAAALDALPAAIYLTDAEGRVTHYNRACIAFAGRTPEPGRDRWCVSHRLFTIEGEPLPHDRCPMAVAIRHRREVRGIEAIAERPDGSRVRFQPFPTLLFDADGRLGGAVNMLIDVTDRHRADGLREQAARCRRLSSSALDSRTLDALNSMACEYEAEADRLAVVH